MTASAPSTPRPAFDYEHATRCADIVMKGGVTSGVVYPLAVCELAQTYRFRGIGGTSVGAIAAAAAAAAECGRYADRAGPGFKILERLPDWLGLEQRGRTNLVWLFHPQPRTKALFETLVAALRHKQKLAWLLVGAVRRFPFSAFLGSLVGLALLALSSVGLAWVSGWLPDLLFGLGELIGIALAGTGAAAGGVSGFLRGAFRELPRNSFGLCAGAGGTETPDPLDPLGSERPPAPLATWLAVFLDALAGRADPAEPITFRDLWWAGEELPPPGPESFRPERERVLNLAMMTTSLTLGRPYRLPFTRTSFPGGEILLFDEDELAPFFPPRIVEWLKARGRERIANEGLDLPGHYFPLPEAPDLPLVVAARLSMSFPLLLSALPLYLWDPAKSLDRERDRCWFSDGGICSNFPVHFFDSPLPRWPTFGINLQGPRRRDKGLSWVLEGYEESAQDSWEDIHGLTGFAHSLKDTVQNWLDNSQQRLPGWRDRIAHVGFLPGEGGINLYMAGETICALSDRGREAAALLRQRFAEPPEHATSLSWDSHRWVRYRSTLSILSRFFEKVCAGWDEGPCRHDRPAVCPRPLDERSYLALIEREAGASPPQYPFRSPEQRKCAREETEELVALVGDWRTSCFEGAPAPEPTLRIAPDL